jgi:hypothetical protein
MTSPLLDSCTFAVIDFETTGIDSRSDRVIEAAVVTIACDGWPTTARLRHDHDPQTSDRERRTMSDPESYEGTAQAGLPGSTGSTLESAIKRAIEQALVAEVVHPPEQTASFTRIFNRDAPDFSRLFSRGGAQIQSLTVRDLATMDDEVFARFTERLRVLQDMGRSESPESS